VEPQYLIGNLGDTAKKEGCTETTRWQWKVIGIFTAGWSRKTEKEYGRQVTQYIDIAEELRSCGENEANSNQGSCERAREYSFICSFPVFEDSISESIIILII